ncbi:MAG: hypothetical protein C3F12_05375 [Candidatus Methylomirabilota bacterium]|nr:hypothetical protein [candidate division NC10 bacterium]PWB47400.1 MAG: hypothetical protein C3F12_05375 [candidate division NC10 bacterium]
MDKAQRGPGGLSEAERDLLLAELWDTFTLKLDHAALATQSLRETAYLFMRAIQGGHVTYKSRDVADPDAPSSMKTVAIQLGKMSGAGYIAPVEGIDRMGESQVSHIITCCGEGIQHVALRIEGGPIEVYRRITEQLGVRYTTPILYDDRSRLLQMFTGSLFRSPNPAAGPFLELNQRLDLFERDPTHFHHATVQALYRCLEELQEAGTPIWILDFDSIPPDWDPFEA